MKLVKKALSLVLPDFILERLGFYIFRIQLFVQGTWPLWRAERTLRKSAKDPKSFDEKVRYKMAFDRNPNLKVWADKVAVREFVSERIGSEYLIQIFGVYSSIENLDRTSLPKNFVLKANHGSGACVICWEGAPRGQEIPKDLASISWQRFLIHPDDLVWKDLIQLSDRWKTLNYYWFPGGFPEWAYRNIRPQLLVEELLSDEHGLPFDYKFKMIHGKCAFIQVDVSRYGNHQRNLYSENWDLINAKTPYPEIARILPPPSKLPEMVKIAEALSNGIDFIRVDLYEIEGRILFGELTNYPYGGEDEIWPKALSIELAKNWSQKY